AKSTAPRGLLTVFLCCALLGFVRLCAQTEAGQRTPIASYDFGHVGLDAEVKYTFTFRNYGSETLEIRQVEVTSPLKVTKLTNRVEPGAEGSVTVEMQKPFKLGEFEGGVVVHFKDDGRKLETVYGEGEISPPIEFIPHNVIFLSTQRGQPKETAVEIVNHEAAPLEILHAECNTARFDCDLKALEAGRRYRLAVILKGEGPGANQTDTIV